MLRLVLNPDTEASVQTFDKDVVVIGSQSAGKADLLLSDENVEETHVTISFVDGEYLVQNTANDPFATVNDLPFGKKNLKEGDCLQVGNTFIRFEEKAQDVVKETKPETPWEKPPPAEIKEESNSHFFWILALVVVSLTMVIASSIYFSVSEQTDEEEMLAAEGVSDIAMALAYAKLNQLTPMKLSWSDPTFLNKALHFVVGSEYPSAAKIDIHGKFADLPYILRIYTSNDLSQFLVIAQPVPSLLNWLVPKKTVIVDSATMELRMVSSLRDLNRLLINLNNPDEDQDNSDVVTSYVKQEALIPLAALGEKKVKKGFLSPEALAKMHPGAENLIYNAPRYYPFSEAVLDQALSVLDNQGDSKKLEQSLETLEHYPHLVFYSSKGMHMAREARRSLLNVNANKDLLVGYVKLDEKGQIQGSYLLDGDSSEEYAALPFSSSPEDLIPKRSHGEPVLEEMELNHPLFLQFSKLLAAREEALYPLSVELGELIQAQNKSPVDHFWEKYQNLMLSYLEANLEQQKVIIQEITNLNQQQSTLPFAELYRYIQAAGLDIFLQENLKLRGSLTADEFEMRLVDIDKVEDLNALNSKVQEVAALLTLDSVPDPENLITYQNTMRLQVLQKLSQFLLSDSTISGDKDTVSQILDDAWITDAEERRLYLDGV